MIAQDIEASLRFAERPVLDRVLSRASQRSYASDLADFEAYCLDNRVRALPADSNTIRAYVSHLAATRGLKITTIKRRLAAISQNHRRRGHRTPVTAVGETVRGIQNDERLTALSLKSQKTALTGEMLSKIVKGIDRSKAMGKRDAALLLLMFSGMGLRRSEAVALDVRDLAIDINGAAFLIRRSQTDQAGVGHTGVIKRHLKPELCAVLALEAWLLETGAAAGAVFQSFDVRRVPTGDRLDVRDVTRIIKRRAKCAGLEGDFASSSIRRGVVTTAVRNGVPLSALMRATRHKDRDVLLACVDGPDPFVESEIPELL